MLTIDQFNRNDLLILLQNVSPHIQNQQLIPHDISLLTSIQSDINFNTLLPLA